MNGEIEKAQSKRLLLVANVVKEHVLKFHVPTIRYLKEQGWTVDVAASGEEIVPHCDRQIRGKWKRSPFTPATLTGIFQLKRIIDEGDYDIVYCHTPVGALVARLAAIGARKRGTKVVYFAHGFHFYKGAPLVNWLLFFPIELLLARFTDLLITLNDEDEARAKKLFAGKLPVRRVPGVGVDFSRLDVEHPTQERARLRREWGIGADSLVLIYVAELIKNKNQGMLFEALKEIQKAKPDTHLVLVGPDHAQGHYQRLAQQRGVADSVVFTGWRSDIGSCLRAADIAVASSIREGLGLNLVEAIYCGLPVVAVKNRGHETVIEDGDNGFLVGDAKAMAERISELAENPKLRTQFISADITKYSASAVTEEIFDILSCV